MTTPQSNKNLQTSPLQDLLRTIQSYLGNRRALMAVAGVAIIAGLTLNWSWLVAAGIAPLLISVLPCIAMCAIGVCCMKKTTGQSIPDSAIDEEPAELPSAKDD